MYSTINTRTMQINERDGESSKCDVLLNHDNKQGKSSEKDQVVSEDLHSQ